MRAAVDMAGDENGRRGVMAELILTDEEKAQKSYLEWSDEAVGRAVKNTMCVIDDYESENKIIEYSSAALLLVSRATDINADECNIKISGVTCRGREIGDWEITAIRVDCPKSQGND